MFTIQNIQILSQFIHPNMKCMFTENNTSDFHNTIIKYDKSVQVLYDNPLRLSMVYQGCDVI